MRKYRIVMDECIYSSLGDYSIQLKTRFGWRGTHRCPTLEDAKQLVDILTSKPENGEVLYTNF